MREVIMDLPIMADSSREAVIHAPFETIDLTEWVFGLTDKEYQACSKDHIAAAAGITAAREKRSGSAQRRGDGAVRKGHREQGHQGAVAEVSARCGFS
jgi:hypothetical protein